MTISRTRFHKALLLPAVSIYRHGIIFIRRRNNTVVKKRNIMRGNDDVFDATRFACLLVRDEKRLLPNQSVDLFLVSTMNAYKNELRKSDRLSYRAAQFENFLPRQCDETRLYLSVTSLARTCGENELLSTHMRLLYIRYARLGRELKINSPRFDTFDPRRDQHHCHLA